MEQRKRHERGWVEQNKKLARERALVILQVRSGALSVKEGAKRLGVSRKTYYEWEEKSLSHGPGAGESFCGKAARACGRREGDPSGTDPGVGEEAGSG